MAIYTGVADANGDFNIAFGGIEYSSGEKIIVTAEKDTATKSIEIFAPSDVTGGGVIQFSGTLDNFPNNIGIITVSQISTFAAYAFYVGTSNVFLKAKGLVLKDAVSLGSHCFYSWSSAETLDLSMSSLVNIPEQCFRGWSKLTNINIPDGVTIIHDYAFTGASACLSVQLPSTLTRAYEFAFALMSSCNEVICLAATPPIIMSNTFSSIKSTCIFKVPAASVAAYQAAPNWSAFAARIQAI